MNIKNFKSFISEATMKKNQVPYKDKILHYQAAQHKKGNKISWDEAKKFIEDGIKALAKIEKKNKAAAKRALKAKNKKTEPKGLTDAQFNKRIKGASADIVGDNPDYDLSDIVWDIANAMMFEPEIDTYVRKKISKHTGQRPENISKEDVLEFIADSIL